MTDNRLTQIGIEQWSGGTPRVQTTQISVEQWAAVVTGNTMNLATQMAVEHWASVAQAAVAAVQARAVILA